MKLNIEALPGEIEAKGDDLLKAVQSLIDNTLSKAKRTEPVKHEYPVLDDISTEMQEAYEKRIKEMNVKIIEVLNKKANE